MFSLICICNLGLGSLGQHYFQVCSTSLSESLSLTDAAMFISCQPMALEELLSDKDSEDELDEDLATVEDRRVYILLSFLFALA